MTEMNILAGLFVIHIVLFLLFLSNVVIPTRLTGGSRKKAVIYVLLTILSFLAVMVVDVAWSVGWLDA